MAGGSQVRGHSRIPAGRVSAPLPNSSVRASPYLQEPSKPRWDSEIPPGEAVRDLGQPSQGKGREERDGGGAEFQSPRNLMPRNLESERETHSYRASLSLRHKSKKEGGRTHTPAPVSLRTLEENGRMGEKNTHMPLFI